MADPQTAATSVGFFAATFGWIIGLGKLTLICIAMGTGLIVPALIIWWLYGRQLDKKIEANQSK